MRVRVVLCLQRSAKYGKGFAVQEVAVLGIFNLLARTFREEGVRGLYVVCPFYSLSLSLSLSLFLSLFSHSLSEVKIPEDCR